MRYRNRTHAGHELAGALQAAEPDAARTGIVLGVPRGGVIVAAAVADALDLPLDVALARKLGAPFNPELAVGAVAEGGVVWLNDDLIARIGGRGPWLDEAIARERRELERRVQFYRSGTAPELTGRNVIVVDDGVATGATLAVVLRTVGARAPGRLICAVPVAPPDSVAMLAEWCDAVVCPLRPRRFGAVGSWFDDFRQNTDGEVVAALDKALRPDAAHGGDQ